MKYITCIPNAKYFVWQTDVMIQSFIDNGVNEEDIFILIEESPAGETAGFHSLQTKYPNVIQCWYSPRTPTGYVASIKPYLLWRFFDACPDMIKERFFICDADIALTKPLEVPESGILVSDTKSYLGVDYIRSKGQDVLELMTKICGVTEDLLIQNDNGAGGAQMVVQDIPAFIWKEAYEKSIQMFDIVTAYNKKISDRYEDGDYPIQIWTSEMWTTIWMLWKYGYKTNIVKGMDFIWANEPIKNWNKTSIYHNAGVTKEQQADGYFYKQDYMLKSPKGEKLDINKNTCTYKYWELIQKTL